MPLQDLMWVEKYRPSKLDDLVNQESIKQRLRQMLVKKEQLPHLMFAGPPGSGKTTTALIIAQQILGEHWRDYTLSLNASDERGIDVVRERVKTFARFSDRRVGIPFRLAVLDEADEMTPDGQTALRRIMEENSQQTRFILICVAPWTKVLLPEEVETTISDLKGKEEASVSSLDLETAHLKDDKVANFIELNPKLVGKRCLGIQTNTGRKLELTEDHLVWTPRGWVPAGQLKVGERVAVFPHLEGTRREDQGIILDATHLLDSVGSFEIVMMNRKRLGEARSFSLLTTTAKLRVANEIGQLYRNLVCTGKGLTHREFDAIGSVEGRSIASRRDIQRNLGLSRARANELLRALERKGYLIRLSATRHSHEQLFRRTDSDSKISAVRNLADIKKLLYEHYSLGISYTTVRDIIHGSPVTGRAIRVIEGLARKRLLPLAYGDEIIGAIARLLGFLLGDGCLASNGRRLIFTGNAEVLNEVKKDVQRLGYKTSETKSTFIRGKIRGRKVEGTTTFFYTDSVELWSLFRALGVPMGDKSDQSYEVPGWVLNGTRFVKREFLRGFFDCESCTPKIERCNFESLWLTQNKTERNLGGGRLFMKQVCKILGEFGVKSVPLRITSEGARLDGVSTFKIKLALRASNSNMLRFFGQIGFFYEGKKRLLGRLGHEYLRYKSHLLEGREALVQRVLVELDTKGRSKTDIAESIQSSVDFIETVQSGKQVDIPRRGLMTFEKWVTEYSIEETEMVWNLVEEIKDIELDSVMDITTSRFHTFISNGLLSHNCNYSSGIIEPLQSRCAIFRFQRLDEGSVVEHLKLIAKKEKVKVASEGVYGAIYEGTQGDLRQAINMLQASSASGEITVESVRSVSGATVKARVTEVIKLALDGNFDAARTKMVELTRVYGIPERDFLRFANESLGSLKVDDMGKAVSILAEYDFRLVQGSQPELQLTAMLAQLSSLKRKED